MKKSIFLLFAAFATLLVGCQREEFDGEQGQQQQQQEQQEQEQEVIKVEIYSIWYNLAPKAKQAEVTSKGDNSYTGWYSGSITIPATVTYNGVKYSVTSIGKGAFSYCSSLTTITLPGGVTSIGESAFQGCSSLKSITIPEGVTSIGNTAFYGCSSLKSVKILAVTPPGIEHYTFDGIASDATLYVPKEAVSTYRSTNPWSNFSSINSL